jgi:hypothetical protein
MTSAAHPDGSWPFDVLEIIRVLDGDTVRLRVDHGHGHSYTLDVRLRGILAPELDEPGGVESQQSLATWLSRHPLSWYQVTTYRRTTGQETWVKSFDRWVGDLIFLDNETVQAVTAVSTQNGLIGPEPTKGSAAHHQVSFGFARVLLSGESE